MLFPYVLFVIGCVAAVFGSLQLGGVWALLTVAGSIFVVISVIDREDLSDRIDGAMLGIKRAIADARRK
jgi:hypothetical protein